MKTIRTGDEALLIYPEGDCDYVWVLELCYDHATVKIPGSAENPFRGSTIRKVPLEDIGIGVDDELQPIFDSERDNRRWAKMMAGSDES